MTPHSPRSRLINTDMHIRDVIDEGSRCLLIGDVEPHAFNPANATEPVLVGLIIDNFGLRVVPIIAEIAISMGEKLDMLARSAIRDHLVHSHGALSLFGQISGYAIIEPSRSGHVLVAIDEEGNPRGRARRIAWLGAVMLTPLRTDVEA